MKVIGVNYGVCVGNVSCSDIRQSKLSYSNIETTSQNSRISFKSWWNPVSWFKKGKKVIGPSFEELIADYALVEYKTQRIADENVTKLVKTMKADKSVKKLDGFDVFHDYIVKNPLKDLMYWLRRPNTYNEIGRLRDSCPRTIDKVLATKNGKNIFIMRDCGYLGVFGSLSGDAERKIYFTIGNGLKDSKENSITLSNNVGGDISISKTHNGISSTTTFYKENGRRKLVQYLDGWNKIRKIYYNKDGSPSTFKNSMEELAHLRWWEL